MENRPLRVIVWGPGGLGSVVGWELHRLPEFDLVGVRAYSPSKVGQDFGSHIGVGPVEVVMTDDVDALLGLNPDCIVYTPRDAGNFNTDDELLWLLERGANVVTPLPFQHAELWREQAFVERLRAACSAGGSSFHATGIDPDVIGERVVLGLTAMCTDVTHIRLREMWEADSVDGDLLRMIGFGRPPAEVDGNPLVTGISTGFLQAIARGAERALGVTYDRVEERHNYIPASKDIESRNISIGAGTVGRVTHEYRGWVESKGGEPFFTVELNWFIGHEMLPEGVEPHQYWIIEIEGRPSIRTVIDLRASLEDEERFYAIGNLRTEPGYHATMAPCLHAIPHVVSAAPGIVGSYGPGLHWKQDLRVGAGGTDS
jgi:hypothetical protein